MRSSVNTPVAYMTGYFGRPTEKGHRAMVTKVHVTRNGKPLCGYAPHTTMQFQWNSQGINYGYIECDCCKEKSRQLILAEANNRIGSK